MESKELIRAGKLGEARSQLVAEVRENPGSPATRTLLFQVMTILGEWDKAERHLDVLAAQDVKTEIGVQVYRNLLKMERQRHEIFALGRRPSLLPSTPPYLEMVFQLWERLNSRDIDGASELQEKIDAARPSISGRCNGKPFSGFSDTDAYLAPFVEAMVHDRYVWVPVEFIREILLTAPQTLLETIWAPAHLTTWEGLTLQCSLPVLYPESCRHAADPVKMGRLTEWIHIGGRFSRGVGQHVFQVGDEEIGLLEIREIHFSPA
jgi:type VI secretion system protein ImpE